MWFLPIHDGRVTSKRAQTNFNFPAPPFNHISGICKNLADTWPAATRVLSRGRKREDPGNEVDYRRGIIQLNATHWLLYRMCQCLRCDFCRCYKFHSLLGSVGKLSAETNFNFLVPPFNHISGICKNLADTWPAATRVLSRGRKREDPGNEVENQTAINFLQCSLMYGDPQGQCKIFLSVQKYFSQYKNISHSTKMCFSTKKFSKAKNIRTKRFSHAALLP